MTDEQTPADDGISAEEGADPTLEDLKAQVAEWRDKALRAAAEAENVRRRTEREANDARAFAIQRFARDLFGAADNLERALAAAPREAAEAAVTNFVLGIEMTEKALRQAFETNGLKRIEPQVGEKFDPHLHQAMMEQEAEGAEPGSVVQTMQAGYELFGRVVRPAMVVVAARRAGAGGSSGGGSEGAKTYAGADGQDAGGALDTKA